MSWWKPDPNIPEEAAWAAVQSATLEAPRCLRINPLLRSLTDQTLDINRDRLQELVDRPLHRRHLAEIVHYWVNQHVVYGPQASLVMPPRFGSGRGTQHVREVISMVNQQITSGIHPDLQATYVHRELATMDNDTRQALVATAATLMIIALDTCAATPEILVKAMQLVGRACGDQLSSTMTDYLIKAVLFARADAGRRNELWDYMLADLATEPGWTVRSALSGALGAMVNTLADARKQGYSPIPQVLTHDAAGVPTAVVDVETIDPTPPPAAEYQTGGDTLWAGGMLWQLIDHAMRGENDEALTLLDMLECDQHCLGLVAVAALWMRDLLTDVVVWVPPS